MYKKETCGRSWLQGRRGLGARNGAEEWVLLLSFGLGVGVGGHVELEQKSHPRPAPEQRKASASLRAWNYQTRSRVHHG